METILRIKSIALANGYEYEDCRLNITKEALLEAIKKREFITILINNKKQEILINSDFVVSLEI